MNLKLIHQTLVTAGLLFFSATTYAQHKAHVHGIANMDVVVEGNTLSVDFHSPLANLVHFEHAPKTDEERAAVKNMVTALRNANAMFVVPEAAQCAIQTVKLASEGLKPELLGEKATTATQHHHHDDHEKDHAHDHDHAHMDLDAEYQFNCNKPENLTMIDVKLINSFPATERINVQAVTPQRQMATTLTQSAIRLQLK